MFLGKHTNSHLSLHSLPSSVSVCLLDLLESRNAISKLLLECLGLRDHRLLITSSCGLGPCLEIFDRCSDRVGQLAGISHHSVDLAVRVL